MENFFNQISSMFNRYTLAQRSVIVTLFIGMLSAIIALVVWANRPEYELLYGDIDPTTASFGILTPYPGTEYFKLVQDKIPEKIDAKNFTKPKSY